MPHGEIFRVGEFAKLSRTTRDKLHHYDKMGLLQPLVRGTNRYRYYSGEQLTVVAIVRALLESGMSLAEIKDLKDQRTPESVDSLLLDQTARIDAKITRLLDLRKFLSTLRASIHSVLNVDENAITTQFLPEEAIILGDVNDHGKETAEALRRFYLAVKKRHPNANLNYPVWAIVSEERVKRGDWALPDRYYFHNPDGRDRRPAGWFVIGYARGGYGRNKDLYARLTEYMEQNSLEICGDAYEEYPLNEVSVPDDENFLMRVMIAVRKKDV